MAQYSRSQIAKIVADEWRNAGLTNDRGIAGVLRNIQEESSYDPTLRHPDQPKFSGEAHYAHGLYQEGGDEWNRYQSWLGKNYPDQDWRDPALQSRFAAQNLRDNYPQVWGQLQKGDETQAATAYASGYLRPAASYLQNRIYGFQQNPVQPLSSYGIDGQPGQPGQPAQPFNPTTGPQQAPQPAWSPAGASQAPGAPAQGAAATPAGGLLSSILPDAVAGMVPSAAQQQAQGGLFPSLNSLAPSIFGAPAAPGQPGQPGQQNAGYMPPMQQPQQLQAPQINYYQPRLAGAQMPMPQFGPLRF